MNELVECPMCGKMFNPWSTYSGKPNCSTKKTCSPECHIQYKRKRDRELYVAKRAKALQQKDADENLFVTGRLPASVSKNAFC